MSERKARGRSLSRKSPSQVLTSIVDPERRQSSTRPEIRGLVNFILDLRACQTPDEEDRCIRKELAKIRKHFSRGDGVSPVRSSTGSLSSAVGSSSSRLSSPPTTRSSRTGTGGGTGLSPAVSSSLASLAAVAAETAAVPAAVLGVSGIGGGPGGSGGAGASGGTVGSVLSSFKSGYNARKNLAKLMYIQLVSRGTLQDGSADIGLREALDLTSSGDLADKRMAFVALSVMIAPDSPMAPMLVSAVDAELRRPGNTAAKCYALATAAAVCTRDVCANLFSRVLDTAHDANEAPAVRRRAVLCLLRMHRVAPEIGLTVEIWRTKLRPLLKLDTIEVLGTLFSVATELTSSFPEHMTDVTQHLVRFLHRAICGTEKKPPRRFEYFGVPCPWVLMRGLKFLQLYTSPAPQSKSFTRLQTVLSTLIDMANAASSSSSASGTKSGGGSERARSVSLLPPQRQSTARERTGDRWGIGTSSDPARVNPNFVRIRFALAFEAIRVIVAHRSSVELFKKACALCGRHVRSASADIRVASVDGLLELASVVPDSALVWIRHYYEDILLQLRISDDVSLRLKCISILQRLCTPDTIESTALDLVKFIRGLDRCEGEWLHSMSRLAALVHVPELKLAAVHAVAESAERLALSSTREVLLFVRAMCRLLIALGDLEEVDSLDSLWQRVAHVVHASEDAQVRQEALRVFYAAAATGSAPVSVVRLAAYFAGSLGVPVDAPSDAVFRLFRAYYARYDDVVTRSILLSLFVKYCCVHDLSLRQSTSEFLESVKRDPCIELQQRACEYDNLLELVTVKRELVLRVLSVAPTWVLSPAAAATQSRDPAPSVPANAAVAASPSAALPAASSPLSPRVVGMSPRASVQENERSSSGLTGSVFPDGRGASAVPPQRLAERPPAPSPAPTASPRMAFGAPAAMSAPTRGQSTAPLDVLSRPPQDSFVAGGARGAPTVGSLWSGAALDRPFVAPAGSPAGAGRSASGPEGANATASPVSAEARSAAPSAADLLALFATPSSGPVPVLDASILPAPQPTMYMLLAGRPAVSSAIVETVPVLCREVAALEPRERYVFYKVLFEGTGVLQTLEGCLDLSMTASMQHGVGTLTWVVQNVSDSVLVTAWNCVMAPFFDVQLSSAILPPQAIPPRQSVTWSQSAVVRSPFMDVPTMHVSFLAAGKASSCSLAVPLAVSSFVSAAPSDAAAFLSEWHAYAGLPHEAVQTVRYRNPDQRLLRKIVQESLHLAVLPAVDPVAVNVVARGELKCAGSSHVVLLRLEPNYDDQTICVTVRTSDRILTSALQTIYAAGILHAQFRAP